MTDETTAQVKANTDEVGRTASEGVSVMGDEVTKLRSELATLIDSVAQLGREKVQAITHNEKINQGVAAGGAVVDRTTAELRALEYDIAEATRAYPWRALGISAAIGFLVGFLARR